ncbi:MAG: preprotein translocase subunit Sec61beta [archaeon]|nr:preprotein translocase subunit Sec61beta [archaeon]
MGDNKIQMPGAFGGIMRYDEEYESRFKISPVQAIGFVVIVILFVLVLKMFWPITA